MCCRYWADDSPEMREIVDEMNKSPLTNQWRETAKISSFGEMRPADVVPVIASNRMGTKSVFPMKWGFTGRTLLMNARSETAATRTTFKDAWAVHRCIVPATHYFEWEHFTDVKGKARTGDRYQIHPRGSAMTWLCGLYRIENGLPVFVILTREASESLRFIHDRMPLIMPERCVDEWIRPSARPERLIPCAMTDMVFEKSGKSNSGDAVQLSMF